MVKMDTNELHDKPVKRARYESFGKHIINTYDLNKRIVNIKYARNSVAIPTLPKTKNVDEDVIAIIFHLLDTGELNEQLMDGLGKQDYDFLANIIFKCGLRRMLKPSRTSRPSDNTKKRQEFWLQRYRVLHGEIQAGNNSTEIFMELRDTVIPGLLDTGVVDENRYHDLQTKVKEILNTP
jgi:hypothetical protein